MDDAVNRINGDLAEERRHVFRIKGAAPEKFCFVSVNGELPQPSLIRMSCDLTEAELRTELEQEGRTKEQIDALINAARQDSCNCR